MPTLPTSVSPPFALASLVSTGVAVTRCMCIPYTKGPGPVAVVAATNASHITVATRTVPNGHDVTSSH